MPSSTPLREILDVFELENQPEAIRNLKNYVKILVYDLFDPKYTYRGQTLDLQHSLLEKTCEKFPHLFVGAARNARICAIRSFAMHRFAYRRLVFQRENGIKGRTVKKEPQLPHPHSPQPPPTRNSGLENDLNSSARRIQTRKSVSTTLSGRSGPRTTAPILALSSVTSEALPPRAPCNSPPSTSSTKLNASPISRTDEVATFLSSCVPSMRYLFNSFTAYGIVNQEYLRTIAKWPHDRIERFLREFSSSKICANIVSTETDIHILAVHFKQCFAQSMEDALDSQILYYDGLSLNSRWCVSERTGRMKTANS